ncbi:response regulator transcription factor [Streptomyces sp. DSM 44917]|uniref:Response regulator transcription factor n=1 Tax=Streptomyces boetiae TaxID=3075541 RepID=A0ABU2L8P4_9ACTN|nr:response regulator transcription factor [Streptomyces sp. DSM 44917]MDT0307872.1 response regulator transcription factor [Streptomyces sp. DSM 44917]
MTAAPEQPSPHPVLVVDDHAVVRSGVARLIDDHPELRVVAEAADAESALAAAARHAPRVVVLDLSVPGGPGPAERADPSAGLRAIRALRDLPQGAPDVVVLSMHGEPAVVRQALAAGAVGYVLKQSVTSELLAAVLAAGRGSVYLSAEVSHVLTAVAAPEAPTAAGALSARERQVVGLIVEGHSTREIAARLAISPKTVEKQRRDAMHKLKVPNVAGLVRAALEAGIDGP